MEDDGVCVRCGQDHGNRCRGHRRKTGEPCRQGPIAGHDKCRFHIGKSQAVAREEAARNATRDNALREAGRLARRVGSSMHPIEHLLDSLYRAAAEVEVFGQMVADLDNAGEVQAGEEPGTMRGWARWTTEIDPVTERPRRVVDMDPLMVRGADGTVHLHPFVKEYNDALERRAKFAKLAMDAGVAERQVQLAESQAALIAGVIRSILTELDVPQDRETIRVVQTHLRELARPEVA